MHAIYAGVPRLADGSDASGDVRNPVLPPNEFTYAFVWAAPEDSGIAVGDALGMEYQDFSVFPGYAEASGRPHEAVRLEVSNGERPQVTSRAWAPDVNVLRATSPPDERDHAPR